MTYPKKGSLKNQPRTERAAAYDLVRLQLQRHARGAGHPDFRNFRAMTVRGTDLKPTQRNVLQRLLKDGTTLEQLGLGADTVKLAHPEIEIPGAAR